MSLKLIALIYLVVALTEGILIPINPVATSYASVDKGFGSRYGYGLVHGPSVYEGIDGNAHPYAYGDLYASNYAYSDLPYNSYVLQPPFPHQVPVYPILNLSPPHSKFNSLYRDPAIYPIS